MTRRDFLTTSASAAMMGWCGCRTMFRRENAALDSLMRAYVEKGLFGGIVCASNRGDLACAGLRTLKPDGGPMTENSVFDLASVGKTQTASLCALLYADGRLDPDAPFTEYQPEHVLAKEGCRITVRDLATHSGGFDNAKPYMTPDPKRYFEKLYAKRPVRARGEKFEYACSNFVYLRASEPQEVVDFILFMASDCCPSITGTTHVIDCGRLAMGRQASTTGFLEKK